MHRGLIAALCALPLGACGAQNDAPAAPTAGEASAVADAEAMLDERAPPEPEPASAPVAD